MWIAGEKEVHLAEPKGEAYSQAVAILLPYLLSHRSRLAAFRNAEGEASVHSSASDSAQTSPAEVPASIGRSYSEAMEEEDAQPGSPVQRQPQDFLAALQPEQRHKLAVLIDTAILKVSIVCLLDNRYAIAHVVSVHEQRQGGDNA